MSMEKNQTSCPKAVCEKIFRAITFGPAFSTISRISRRPQTPSPAKLPAKNNPSLPNSDPPLRTPDVKTKLTSPQRPKPASKEGSEVTIKFDYTSEAKAEKGNGQTQVPIERNPSNKEEAGKKPTNYDDRFTAFINSTRDRIRSQDQEHGENSPKVVGHNHGHGFGKGHHHRQD